MLFWPKRFQLLAENISHFYQQFWANFRSVHSNSKNKLCEFFLSLSDLKQQGGKLRAIFINGMNFQGEMWIGNSSWLRYDLMLIWATSKGRQAWIPRQGPRFSFPWVRISNVPGRKTSLSSALFMMLWVASNNKPNQAGLNNKEKASSGTIRGKMKVELVSQRIKVVNKDLCSVHLSTLCGHKRAATASDTINTRGNGRECFPEPAPQNPVDFPLTSH